MSHSVSDLLKKHTVAVQGWVPINSCGDLPTYSWHMLTFAPKQVDFWIQDCEFQVVPVLVGSLVTDVPVSGEPSHVVISLPEATKIVSLLEKVCVTLQNSPEHSTLISEIQEVLS